MKPDSKAPGPRSVAEHRGPAPHSLEQGSLSEGHPSAMAASQGGASCLPAFSSVLSLVKIKSLFLFGFFFFFLKRP